MTKQALWMLGLGNITFYDFDGVAFTNEGDPVLFVTTAETIPLKVRKRLEGKRIKIVELNEVTDYVTVY